MKRGFKSIMGRLIIAAIIAFFLKYIGIETDKDTNSTLFNVIGIFYSIVMSLYVSFNMDKIKHSKLRKSLKELISDAIYTSSIEFTICMLLYVFSCDNTMPIETVYFSLSVIFMIVNLLDTYKLQQDIADEIFKEEQDHD